MQVPKCLWQHFLQQPVHGSNLDVHRQMHLTEIVVCVCVCVRVRVCVCNGILLNYKKEHIRVNPNEVVEPSLLYRVK